MFISSIPLYLNALSNNTRDMRKKIGYIMNIDAGGLEEKTIL